MSSGGRAAILIGGGAAGAVLSTSDSFKEQIGKYISVGAPAGSDGALSSKVVELTNQLKELKQLAMVREGAVTVVHSGQGSGVGAGNMLLVSAVVGTAGAGYMWIKGYHWDDLFYVTRAKLEEATQGLVQRLSVLGDALGAATAALNEKLGFTEAELKGDITNMRDHLGGEIQGARDAVYGVRDQVGSVQRQLEDVSGQVDGAFGRLDYTSKGIRLLCNVLAETVPGNSHAMAQLRHFARTNPEIENGNNSIPLSRSLSLPSPDTIENNNEEQTEEARRRPLSSSFPGYQSVLQTGGGILLNISTTTS